MGPGKPTGREPAAQRSPEYRILQYAGPGRAVVNIGMLLLDPDSDRLHMKLRTDWADIAASDDAEVLAALEDELRSRAERTGASALLADLEDSLSNTVRITDRQAVEVSDFEEALAELYREHIR